jgi:hypothetical protein
MLLVKAEPLDNAPSPPGTPTTFREVYSGCDQPCIRSQGIRGLLGSLKKPVTQSSSFDIRVSSAQGLNSIPSVRKLNSRTILF